MQQESDAAYSAQREALLSKLTPKQSAMFNFMEHLVEQTQRPDLGPLQPRVRITWQNRTIHDAMTRLIREQDLYSLNLPSHTYGIFGWTIGYAIDPDKDNIDDENLFRQVMKLRKFTPTRGNWEIRIVDRGENILLLANGGGFSEMTREWEDAVGSIPYPMVVEDKNNLRFENQAYKAKFGKPSDST